MRLYLTMILIPILACNVESDIDKNYAKTGIFYFEISQEFSGTNKVELESEISKILPNKQYAITNSSGKTWPFFEEYSLSDQVLISDLMTPHTISHALVNIKGSNREFNKGDAKLKITLKEKEGEYSFDMIIYKWKPNGWVKIVNTGNHKISKNRYESKKELIQIIYKTIVRYSFK